MQPQLSLDRVQRKEVMVVYARPLELERVSRRDGDPGVLGALRIESDRVAPKRLRAALRVEDEVLARAYVHQLDRLSVREGCTLLLVVTCRIRELLSRVGGDELLVRLARLPLLLERVLRARCHQLVARRGEGICTSALFRPECAAPTLWPAGGCLGGVGRGGAALGL